MCALSRPIHHYGEHSTVVGVSLNSLQLTREGQHSLSGATETQQKSYEFDCVFAPNVNGSQEDVSGLCGSAH